MNGAASRPPTTGACLDGIYDVVATEGQPARSLSAAPGSIVLPADLTQPILAGTAADGSRAHLGLPWPPDAGFQLDTLRRAPVPLLWRLLVQSRDGRATWPTKDGVRHPVAHLLGLHAKAQLAGTAADALITVAIPNALSAYGQQRLLDALRRTGLSRVALVWRPVALALSWLAAIGDDLQPSSADESLLVFHVAPDSIECVELSIREQVHEGSRFLVPLRGSASAVSRIGGWELVAQRILASQRKTDAAGLWFALLTMSQLWGGDESEGASVDSVVWPYAKKWSAFDLSAYRLLQDFGLEARMPAPFERLLENPETSGNAASVREDWKALCVRMLDAVLSRSQNRIRGAILSGVPFTSNHEGWTQLISRRLERRLSASRAEAIPRADSIWVAKDGGQAIACGAALVGARARDGLPTFLDTLPHFDVWAVDPDGGGAWSPLVPSREQSGSATYSGQIRGKFVLPAKSKSLEVHLRLGEEEDRPIRRTRFYFPRPAPRKMPLDLHITMRPAGGLAVVEIVPADLAFLGGINVYLDYEDMEEVSNVPSIKLGWPPLEVPHEVDPTNDLILRPDFQRPIEWFLEELFGSPSYAEKIKDLKKILSTTRQAAWYGRATAARRIAIVTADGRAGTQRGQRVVEELATKLRRDFEAFYVGQRKSHGDPKLRDQLLSTASMLYAGTPQDIRDFVVQDLSRGRGHASRASVLAAGRSFCTAEEARVFFAAMVAAWRWRESDERPRLQIYWLYSAARILGWREAGTAGLDRGLAGEILRFLLRDFRLWLSQRRKMGIRAALRVLFYLFRFRIIERDFLSPEAQPDRERRRDVSAILDDVRREFVRPARGTSPAFQGAVLEMSEAILQLLDYSATLDVIQKVAEQFGDSEVEDDGEE